MSQSFVCAQAYHLRVTIHPHWYRLCKTRLSSEDLADFECSTGGYKDISRLTFEEFYTPTDSMLIRHTVMHKIDGTETRAFVDSFDLVGALTNRRTADSKIFDVYLNEGWIGMGNEPSGMFQYSPSKSDRVITFPIEDIFKYTYRMGGIEEIRRSSKETETIRSIEQPKVLWPPEIVSAFERTGFKYDGLNEEELTLYHEPSNTYFSVFLKVFQNDENDRLDFLQNTL